MGWFAQTWVVTSMFLRTVPQRLGSSLAAAFGVAGVVTVMVAVFSIAVGFRHTLERAGSPDIALVMRTGADSEMSSSMTFETTRIIADAPGVLRDADGPVVSAEMVVLVDLPKRSTGTEANVPLRGVQTYAFDVRDKIEIVEGRRFEPGRNEIMVGVGAQREFSGLDLGSTLRWGDSEWSVVGVFSSNGALPESELWADVRVLQPFYKRGNVFQSVRVKLAAAQRFDEFKDALNRDPRLAIKVMREEDYYAAQSEFLYGLIMVLGVIVGGLMGLGAIFGAINTMYSAVAARTREIATLRAIGFGGVPVIISVLTESLLLAGSGGVVGGIVAYAACNGFQASTLNFQTFSQVAFQFEVTPALLVAGVVASLFMGLIGGLFPAVRAARIPVATALREL